jgi:hypothetical protein
MDPATISAIAAAAVGFLSPYLAKAGEAVARKVGEDVYGAIKTSFEGKTVAQEALSDLEKSPNDTDLQAALRVQLRKLLAEDESFAAQLQGMLQEAGETEAGATIIQQVAGDDAKQFGQVFGNVTFS